jgi:hypothetical protein
MDEDEEEEDEEEDVGVQLQDSFRSGRLDGAHFIR